MASLRPFWPASSQTARRAALVPACAASTRSPARRPPGNGNSQGQAQRRRPGGSGSGSGGGSGGERFAVDSAPAWRVFVNVPATQDPGKDDYTVHPALLAMLSKKLGVRAPSKAASDSSEGAGGGSDDSTAKAATAPPLPAEAVRVVRKSFDARTSKGGDPAG